MIKHDQNFTKRSSCRPRSCYIPWNSLQSIFPSAYLRTFPHYWYRGLWWRRQQAVNVTAANPVSHIERLDKKMLQIWVTSLVNICKRTIVPSGMSHFPAIIGIPVEGQQLQLTPPVCQGDPASVPGANLVLYIRGRDRPRRKVSRGASKIWIQLLM